MTPIDSEDIGAVIKILVLTNTTFAIESGGHSSVIGASNIDGAVTLDMSAMWSVDLSEDGKSVTIGTGARWLEVYKTLEASGLAVSGGRVSDIGVGGYILGGGFSWYSNQFGWTCDMVEQYEVVLWNGSAVTASNEQYRDLFWSLKGGSTFGIATKFTLPTIAGPEVYGGPMIYADNEAMKLFEALAELNHNASADISASGYLSFGYLQQYGRFVNVAYLVSTDGDGNSPSFRRFESIPRIYENLRIMNMSTSALEINNGNPRGFWYVEVAFRRQCPVSKLKAKKPVQIHINIPQQRLSHVSYLRHLQGQRTVTRPRPERAYRYILSTSNKVTHISLRQHIRTFSC